MIRDLTSNEIECKVAMVSEKGCQLLLYKTARTDAKILDEVYGEMNWQCRYEEVKGNMYCTISIWDKEKGQWINKQDCGIESAFGDKEKGEASDAFKRAGFKWGIGVELYNSPFIWIPAEKCKKLQQNNGKYVCRDKFEVEAIEIKDKEITGLAIRNGNTKEDRCFVYKKGGK